MNVSVVGTGYVGLVTGTCFAAQGNQVTCIDNNPEKVAAMQRGEMPIVEPGLQELFDRTRKEGNLTFTTDLTEGVLGASAIFLALPTPEGEDGSADLSYVLGVADDLGKILTDYVVIVDKSTVPVGTTEKVREAVAQNAKTDFDVVSNPEFLREGAAVGDFMKPDRVVIGSSSERARKVMRKLYRPFVKSGNPIIETDEPTAEMIKYAANGFLAVKISYMNELAAIAERLGADIEGIRAGIGTDPRIGKEFLYPGPGWGGSCFPKDTLAMLHAAGVAGHEFLILEAAVEANERAKQVVASKVESYFEGDLEGKTIALWGLAFKARTDDIRESPALVIANQLIEKGATIRAFDPAAMENVQKQASNPAMSFGETPYDALEGADALVIATEWDEFKNPDITKMKKLLKNPAIFDGRNLYSEDALEELREKGFHYESIGRVAL